MNLALTDEAPVGAIATCWQYVIQSGHHEVKLKDGTDYHLHFIAEAGVRHRWLRAIDLRDGPYGRPWFVIVDLRQLATSLAVDIPGYLERDVPGLITYTLRAAYPTEVDLMLRVSRVCEAVGEPRLQ